MSVHRTLEDLFKAFTPNIGPGLLKDPGSAGNIVFGMWGQICLVNTTGGGARTLPVPTRAGVLAGIVLDTDGADLVLTVTSGYNRDEETSITFADAGDYVLFWSVKIGTAYRWRAIAQEGTNAAVEEGTFDTITAAAGTITALTSTTILVTTLTVTTVTAADLVINSTNEMNIQIGGVSVLAIDDAAIAGNAAASDTDGKDVYIETQDGGPAITSEPGPNAADYVFKTGDGSQGFDTEDEDGGAGGAISRTGGNGGRAGLISGGTADGGNGASISDSGGNGGNGGDASGTDGDGGDYSIDAGSPGTGGNTAGVSGTLSVGVVKAEAVNIGRTGKTTIIKGASILREDMLFGQDAHTSESTGAQTIAAADFVNGIVVHSVAAASALSTPTGAEITAVLPAGATTGDAFYLRVITIGSGADDISTLTAGDGDVTFVGNVTVGPDDGTTATNGFATWIFRIANIATDEYVGYRVG